ncbi:hypothetical protein AVEN_37009-1, partial [Araneus ventricosus]
MPLQRIWVNIAYQYHLSGVRHPCHSIAGVLLISASDIHATPKRGYFTLGVRLNAHKFNFHGKYLVESRFEPGKLLSFR